MTKKNQTFPINLDGKSRFVALICLSSTENDFDTKLKRRAWLRCWNAFDLDEPIELIEKNEKNEKNKGVLPPEFLQLPKRPFVLTEENVEVLECAVEKVWKTLESGNRLQLARLEAEIDAAREAADRNDANTANTER